MPAAFLRYILLLACLCFITVIANAQDKIYLDDGTIIEAKVREINPRNIIYRRWDNQDGADYILNRREVNRIVYQNGVEETGINGNVRRRPFDKPTRSGTNMNDERNSTGMNYGDNRNRAMDTAYGRNILAVAPVQMTEESVAGLGLHYERIIDKAGILALTLPVAISFFDEQTGNNPARNANRIFTFIYPGAKIYPGGSGRRVAYSVGPGFGLGFGTKYKLTRSVDPGTGSVILRYDDASVFKAGFMINNGINIQPTKSLYAGVEFGIGILYFNNEESDYSAGDKPIVQFNFKMGYRF